MKRLLNSFFPVLTGVFLITFSPVSDAGIFEHLAEKAISKAAGHAFDTFRPISPSDRSSLPSSGAKGIGFEGCSTLFPRGVPPTLPPQGVQWKTRELCFDSFAVLHSGLTRTPVFSVERLTRSQILDAKDEKRTDVFFADARLPRDERAELGDYQGSGFDRGHMSPGGDMPNPNAMAQSFSLANIIPQAPKNNQTTWQSVESSTRKYVLRAKGNVFVFTGPAFLQDVGTLRNRVKIPSHIYKLVYDEESNRAWAYWMENSNSARIQPPISYQEFSRRLGFELLPGLSPER